MLSRKKGTRRQNYTTETPKAQATEATSAVGWRHRAERQQRGLKAYVKVRRKQPRCLTVKQISTRGISTNL
jgi:hypothetical protein